MMMESPIELQLGRYWWVVALRGLIGIIFGILAFIWPGITLVVLIAFFGAYMFVDGVFALVQAIRLRHERERWPMLLLEGILGIAVGLITYFWPGLTAIAWLYTIAAWAIITGVLEIVTAVRFRKIVQGEFLLILTGLISILLGVVLALMPLAGLLAWVYLIGAYAIVFGALLIGFAFRLRGMGTGRPVVHAP